MDTENKNEKNSKTSIIRPIILVASLIVITVSFSYAYYSNSVDTSGDTGVTVTSGELSINFSTTQYINATDLGLIDDTDVLTSGNYTEFTVELPSGASVSSTTYQLYLTDTSITSNFKSEYLKWALYTVNDGSVGSLLSSGTFADVTLGTEADGVYSIDDISLVTSQTLSKGSSQTYRVYIWLSNDDDVNQISLTSGSLSTKVGITATT